MRLAGTCSRYSKSAIPQLANAATYHGRDDRLRRWAYQANVMKTFEAMRRQTVTRIVRIDAMVTRRAAANQSGTAQPGGTEPLISTMSRMCAITLFTRAKNPGS